MRAAIAVPLVFQSWVLFLVSGDLGVEIALIASARLVIACTTLP
jgi:hypothetical protein